MQIESRTFNLHDLEVDVVLEHGTDLVLVEAKSAQTPSGQLFTAFDRFAAALGKPGAPRVAGRVVVYGGDESQKRSQGEILSWREMDDFDWIGG